MRIEIDRALPLHEGAERGHNRWHPELEPVASCEPGDEVTFEVRDSRDRTIGPDSDHADLLDTPSLAHPLTGPLAVAGAEPGDVLELEVLAYETDDFGWTAIWPGSGFLGDLFERPFLARWELDGDRARSQQVPGVTVRACAHAGVIGVAPSLSCSSAPAPARRRSRARPARPPSWPGRRRPPTGCPPTRRARTAATWTSATSARALGCGCRCTCRGALLSVGDLHFAQGDGEVCISAIETGGSASFRVGLRRGGWRPTFPCYEAPPRPPRAMFATTGIPLADAGSQGDLDLNLATRRALLELLGWLTAEHGLEREAAYVLMSVAAELRVSELVDAPNALVSAALPLDVFDAG